MEKHNQQKKKVNQIMKCKVLDNILLQWHLGQDSADSDALVEAAREIWKLLPSRSKIDPNTGKCYRPAANSWPDYIRMYKTRFGVKDCVLIPKKDINTLRRIITQYEPEQVYNMDECGLFWKNGPSVSLIGHTDRISFAFCVNADGSDKLPLYFMGNSDIETKRVWKSNKTTWMTPDQMDHWLGLFNSHVKGKQVLLIMDDYSAHKFCVFQAKIPSNIRIELTKSSGMPLNQGIIYNVKNLYTTHALIEHLDARKYLKDVNDCGVAPSQKNPKLHIKDAIWWFESVWMDEISAESIKQIFQKSIFYDENAVDVPFKRPPSSTDLIDLHIRVVKAANIIHPLSICDLIAPPGEDIPPISQAPTIPELVHISRHRPKREFKPMSKMSWIQAVEYSDKLMNFLKYTPNTELKKQLRLAVKSFKYRIQQEEIEACDSQLTLTDSD